MSRIGSKNNFQVSNPHSNKGKNTEDESPRSNRSFVQSKNVSMVRKAKLEETKNILSYRPMLTQTHPHRNCFIV